MFRRLGVQCLRNIIPRSNGPKNMNYSKIYEPDYLEAMKPKFPIYENINIQIKGYDYALLESYQRFLYKLGDSMDLDITDGWAVPPQRLQITRLKPKSTIVETQYNLCLYERTVQIEEVSAPVYTILLRLAQAALPEGVSIEFVAHQEEFTEIRYVPDSNLLELKKELEELGGARKAKRKR